MSLDLPDSDAVIAAALAEDLGVPVAGILGGVADLELLDRDVTSASVVAAEASFKGAVVARQAGVVCGLPVIARVYEMLTLAIQDAGSVEVFPLVAEGSAVEPGDAVAEITGRARVVLAGERTALNLLMMLSGIASVASRWQEEAGEGLHVVDTRKTLPGLRMLSKYAVRVGGAHNHRIGLFDMVLVKDNHIRHAGGISAAVDAARETVPGVKIEVEADTIEQAVEAARAGADMVLLDNMDDATLGDAVAAVREAAAAADHVILTEASGNIRRDRLAALREIGVDRVSSSALTLAQPLDFGFDEVNPE